MQLPVGAVCFTVAVETLLNLIFLLLLACCVLQGCLVAWQLDVALNKQLELSALVSPVAQWA